MDVRLITFTGSGRTGRLIQEAASKSNIKNVILELGGKSPAVIFGDADLERAAKETAHSIQWNSGQVCMANSRVYVHASVADRFLALFKESFESVKLGDPLDPDVTHGPQADRIQFDTVKDYVEIGKQEGKLVFGGEVPSDLKRVLCSADNLCRDARELADHAGRGCRTRGQHQRLHRRG